MAQYERVLSLWLPSRGFYLLCPQLSLGTLLEGR